MRISVDLRWIIVARVVLLRKTVQHGVQPYPCPDVVKPCNDHVEAPVEIRVLVLDLPMMSRHLPRT